MALILSKILPIFIFPLTLAIVLLVVSLGLQFRGRRRALALLLSTAAVLTLWILGTPVVAGRLYGGLEADFPPAAVNAAASVDAVVLLGGILRQPLSPRVEADFSDTADRIIDTWRLFRAGKANWILVCGGNLPWLAAVEPEAVLIRDVLVELGVPEERIVLNSSSRNTRENAINASAIFKARGWHSALLVTSALHMPRALASFRRAGMDPVPFSSDVRIVKGGGIGIVDVIPTAESLSLSTSAIREWLGGLYYRFQGWT